MTTGATKENSIQQPERRLEEDDLGHGLSRREQ